MFGMLLLFFGIDNNIIDEDHYEFVELRHKHRVHEVHEVGWGICETKGHHQELVETIMSGESSSRNVTRSNFDFMITRMEINLGQNSGSSQLIKKNIDSGKRIFVLDGHRIERLVIHTQLKLPSFFLT
jgi:predicted oxidoreductase